LHRLRRLAISRVRRRLDIGGPGQELKGIFGIINRHAPFGMLQQGRRTTHALCDIYIVVVIGGFFAIYTIRCILAL
jgi:hypothetical protein